MKTQIDTLKSLAKSELFEILNYWSFETIDNKNGGFIGEIDYENHKNRKNRQIRYHWRTRIGIIR